MFQWRHDKVLGEIAYHWGYKKACTIYNQKSAQNNTVCEDNREDASPTHTKLILQEAPFKLS